MTTQTVIQAPNQVVQPYMERLLRNAEAERLRQVTPYRAPRVEGATRDQLAALQGIRSLQTPGQLKDAQNLYGKAANLAGSEAGFQAGNIDARYDPRAVSMFAKPGDLSMFSRPSDVQMFGRPNDVMSTFNSGVFDSSAAERYMNPYQQGVTDIAKREAERMHQQQDVDRGLQAARQGAFGGSRATILEGEARRNQNQLLNDIQTKGLSDAYTNAQQQFERDRQGAALQAGMGLDAGKFNAGQAMQHGQLGLSNDQFNRNMQMNYGLAGLDLGKFNVGTAMDYGKTGLQNSQFNEGQRQNASDMQLRQQIAQEQARLGAAGHRLGAIQSMTPMAQGIADIGRQQFGMTMDKYNALNQMGEQQRQIGQSALDSGYQEFLRQQNWNRDSMGWQTGIMSGVPMGMNSFNYSSNGPSTAPSTSSAIAGGIAGGLGAWGYSQR